MNDAALAMLARLQPLGKPCFPDGTQEYVLALGLTDADIPALSDLALCWADKDWAIDTEDEGVIFAPVHAWRALVQLRTPSVARLMLDMLDPAMDMGDDWLLEDTPELLPTVSALHPDTLPLMEEYLLDERHDLHARLCVLDALEKHVVRNQIDRERIVLLFQQMFAAYKTNDVSLNGFLISSLVDLRVVEAADIIERAYAEDYVDPFVISWRHVKEGLGVPGTGLLPDPPPPSAWSLAPPPQAHEPPQPIIIEQVQESKTKRRKSKHKKKMSDASRRKNRKRK
jgi:hypothetical protein